MKKKITIFLLTIALLAGCEATPAAVPATTTVADGTPDIDAIVQQSVTETIAQYEEEQREKDVEVAELKAQLEKLISQAEGTPDLADQPESVPAEESSDSASG